MDLTTPTVDLLRKRSELVRKRKREEVDALERKKAIERAKTWPGVKKGIVSLMLQGADEGIDHTPLSDVAMKVIRSANNTHPKEMAEWTKEEGLRYDINYSNVIRWD